MSSPGFQMSLEHQIPVLLNKTQMSGEHGAAPCGLTSLLPLSCRGRAAAFARDLHSRLRSLSAPDAAPAPRSPPSPHSPRSPRSPRSPHSPRSPRSPRDHETFYDFELECESPSSPADEFDFAERSPDQPFFDLDSDSEETKLKKEKAKTNGFRFATAFYSDASPVKAQPAPRENGHADKQLYSAITFEGCARQNSFDEVDCAAAPARLEFLPEPFPEPLPESLLEPRPEPGPDSDSEFESAKSEPSDVLDDTLQLDLAPELDKTENIESISITEVELPTEEDCTEVVKPVTEHVIECSATENETPEVVIVDSTEASTESKESSPALEAVLLDAARREDDADDDKPQRVRRCSSLKTGKTPPGTPGRKKIVRFADVLGLDLADVKTFMDEIPVIPKSAYDDLTGCDAAGSPPARAPPRLGSLTLAPLFQLPRDPTPALQARNVCLEAARVGGGVHINVCGSVRVRNLDFHKTVHVRYTMNGWRTYTDLQATYVAGSCDGYCDRFQFVLYAPCIASGQRLEVAIRFQCKGQQFWDNNNGVNYCFDCLALGAAGAGAGPAGAGAGAGAGGGGVAGSPLHPTVDWHPSFY